MFNSFLKAAESVDVNSPEFAEQLYAHLVSIGANKGQEDSFKKDFEEEHARRKAKYQNKESKMSDTDNPELRKIAALQAFVGAHYIPEFVKACAEHGLQFESDSDLAHALQLNGKFASLVSSGVSVDALIDTIVSNLNVKHAQEGEIKISLASMNHALDAGLEAAGIPVGIMNKAASADVPVAVSDEELLTFLDVVS